MLYFFSALLLLIGIVILYKTLMPVGEPNMELTGIMTEEELKAKLIDLAVAMNGNGNSSLSSHLIRKTISRTYKRISQKVGRKKCLDFENWIYDNYYKLSEVMARQKKLTLSYNKLAGYKELPRIYHIAQLIVKSCGGAVDIDLIGRCIDAVNEVLPLKFNEVELLPDAVNLALLEYIAIFCARSDVINSKFKAALADIAANKIDLSLVRYNSYAYAFVKYASGKMLKRFNSICESFGLSAYKRADNFLSACTRYTGAVSAAIRSLYSLNNLDDEFVLVHCPLNNYLCKCKGIVYKDCTSATKHIYLQRLAKRAKEKSEIAYAGEIVEKARKENKDIAYYILPKPLGKFALIVYILIIVGYTISNCVTVYMYMPQFKWVAAIIFTPISLNLVLMFVTSINIRIFHRRFMPRIRLKGTERAMIVFTVLVFDKAELDEMIDKLLTVSYANNDEIFSYGLLVDLPASETERTQSDSELIAYAKQRFEKLGDRFNLFLRKKSKVENENKYQGWEKKRGAILELNNLILTGEKGAFEAVCGNSYDVEYVITLDSDTILNCAYELVEIMEHPFNADKAVVALNVRTAPSSIRTPFAEIMNDSVGLNNYSNFIADANYDIFGSGNYTGKGIYRVKEFTRKVGDVFMENRVLSHDFVEGAIAGCGSSGESALDSYPETFSSYLSRNIRWLRGDYQLLPFLFTRIRDGKGRHKKNPVSVIARMHILNNIILGLIPLATAILLVLSLFTARPIWLTVAAFSLNLFMWVGTFRLIFNNPKRVWYETVRQLLMVTCLPVIAYNYTKAIVITLFRLITKKNLLDWSVFAHSKGKVSFLPNIIAVGIYVGFAIFKFKWTFAAMALIFAFGIVLAYLLSEKSRLRPKLSESEESRLKKVAADTWIFFDKQLNEKNNYLPFDNYQEYGETGYAPRTSPTDIAFMLTSLVCAFNMEFITKDEFDFYAEKVLLSIEAADKWRGNLYNWINVYTLKRLNGYVSAVDSGNLMAALILLRNVSDGRIAERADKLIENTDLAAFFDENRGLLRIGFDVDGKSYDQNHYDLLGSEATLTYLVGIGTGKLKSSCFVNLSGRCVKFKGTSLYSWSGGAFEYMMTSIFFNYCRGGLLYNSAKAVLKANKAYARRNRLPFWGASESQYAAFDDMGNYQYKAFGVPNIALSNERRRAVVAPYASMLFLPFFPVEASRNLAKMYERGLKGEDGLYEAFDGEVIRTYMSHHQGMILASICNYFYDNKLVKQTASPDMQAASLLITMCEVPSARRKKEYKCLQGKEEKIIEAKRSSPPTINLMTNGRYSVLIDSDGNGYSYYDGKYISRHYSYDGGLKLFLSYGSERINTVKHSYFFDGRCEFCYSDGRCSVNQLVAVLPNMNGEVRSVRIKNLTRRNLDISLESYMEVALNPLYDDIAHKTFSGMFVSTEKIEGLGIIAKRNSLILSHFFDVEASYESNRSNFSGRSKGASFGRVLDPIVSGKVELSLQPDEERTVRLYTLVSEDIEKLKRQASLTKTSGFFERIISGCAMMSRGFGISEKMRRVMSKLLFDGAPNLLGGEFPLVYIHGNAVTENIKGKIKMLSRLKLWGANVQIAFIYYGDGFARERLMEQLAPILDKNCRLSLINEKENAETALLALRSATDIDEIDFEELPYFPPMRKPTSFVELPKPDYAFKLGKGGFLKDGSYALSFAHNDLPPRPWSNVIANENFGTIITESGGGYTFGKNSRENKLTEFSNDPVADGCSEGVVIFEGDTAWSISFGPVRAEGEYNVIHGFGYTEFRSGCNAFDSRMREFIYGETKYFEVTLNSACDYERKVSLLFFVSPVIGDFKFKCAHNLSLEFDGKLKVRNLYNGNEFYLGCDRQITNYVCHKQSYCDANGNFHLFDRDIGFEVAPAVTVQISVPPKGTVKATFYISADGNAEPRESEKLLQKANKYYSELSCLRLETGNPALDYLAKWLPYQIMTSRFYGRTGFYQTGGAIGFRDQLQDCLGVLYIDPQLVRKHILDCAAHQFEAGDVQHWWHPPRTGVRTHITDDRLFLPYITAEYINFTGDDGILLERVPYLEDVKFSGKDWYGSPAQTVRTGTLYEHCIKAIKASAKLGENGLTLMGGGDWNDAMDKVGALGKGTSVWGSMFLYMTISKFMPFVKNKKPLFDLKNRLSEAIEKAWDGEWFVRAYCDDGTVLGSSKSGECNIDLITQSFAALSGSVGEKRAVLALYSAASRLVDTQNGIIKLLTPPLKNIKAGYICDYPSGVRENGGQYTHGAIWFIMSLFAIGEADYAYSLLDMISPVNHSRTPSAVRKYEVEPYVISADVYSEPAGKGGWSWYTGAAAWYYHVLVRYLFGIEFRGDTLTISPSLPSSMKEASFVLRRGKIELTVKIDNGIKEGNWQICINGRGYNTNTIAITESLDKKEIILRRYK